MRQKINVKKSKKRKRAFRYQMIPYEDWKHLQSINTPDRTKGLKITG